MAFILSLLEFILFACAVYWFTNDQIPLWVGILLVVLFLGLQVLGVVLDDKPLMSAGAIIFATDPLEGGAQISEKKNKGFSIVRYVLAAAVIGLICVLLFVVRTDWREATFLNGNAYSVSVQNFENASKESFGRYNESLEQISEVVGKAPRDMTLYLDAGSLPNKLRSLLPLARLPKVSDGTFQILLVASGEGFDRTRIWWIGPSGYPSHEDFPANLLKDEND